MSLFNFKRRLARLEKVLAPCLRRRDRTLANLRRHPLTRRTTLPMSPPRVPLSRLELLLKSEITRMQGRAPRACVVKQKTMAKGIRSRRR
jgi:hypothetical protein